jgi:hypothetical protein
VIRFVEAYKKNAFKLVSTGKLNSYFYSESVQQQKKRVKSLRNRKLLISYFTRSLQNSVKVKV